MITITSIIETLGGLGLFLLGMIIMTGGLKELAGDAIRRALVLFTHSPLSGAITGAVSTAILQSSSATTVAVVGFVGAGLMGFTEALGIIFGANIGSTITGWLVALLGFKYKLGNILLPLIFVGAVLRLFAKGWLASFGYTIAGFGLIFVGIAEMQQGMSEIQKVITPDVLPGDTVVGMLKLVATGMLITLVTQSSGAGVAATLTALYAGAIEFQQAAALVIGMDIGTTVTAFMATIGGSVGAKRTGYSHVIYNLFTGLFALVLVLPYIQLWEHFAPGELHDNAEVALVAFHTTFNTLGVVLVLPFTRHFARMIIRLVPERVPAYAQGLDSMLLTDPVMALNAVQTAINSQFNALLIHVKSLTAPGKSALRQDLSALQASLDRTQEYIDHIHLPLGGSEWERLVAMIHTLDHLQRLHERCEEDEDRAVTVIKTEGLEPLRLSLAQCVDAVLTALDNNQWAEAEKLAGETQSRIIDQVTPFRKQVMQEIALGNIDVAEGTDRLEAIRWLTRVSKHLEHIVKHYVSALTATGKSGAARVL